MPKRIFALLIILSAGGSAFCGPTGLPFLNLGVGAAGQSMGGAYSALAQDASATYWNPSALSKLDSSQIFAYHNQFVSDLSYSYFAFAKPFKNSAFGLS